MEMDLLGTGAESLNRAPWNNRPTGAQGVWNGPETRA